MGNNQTTLKRINFLYSAQRGLTVELKAIDTALEAGRMSVRVDFVTPTYVGPHDIPLDDSVIEHVGILVKHQIKHRLEQIENEIKDLGFDP